MNSLVRAGIVHFDPSNPEKVLNPETRRYVSIDGPTGKSILRKYGTPVFPDLSDSNDRDAQEIIRNQIFLYREYVAKDRFRDGADIVTAALDDVEKRLDNMSSDDKIANIVQEMTEVFNTLQEKGFRMGRAKYPGPNHSWKLLVERYLLD